VLDMIAPDMMATPGVGSYLLTYGHLLFSVVA
jgi:hypothetical protein